MSYIHNSYSLNINRTSVLGSFHQHAPFLLKTWGFSHDLSHSDGLWIQGSVGADLLIHLCCWDVLLLLQHYAQCCAPAPQSGLVIVGGRVTSRRLGKEGKEGTEGRGKKKGEVGRSGKLGIAMNACKKWLSNHEEYKQHQKKERMEIWWDSLEGGSWRRGGGVKGFPRHPSCDKQDQQVASPSHGNYASWLPIFFWLEILLPPPGRPTSHSAVTPDLFLISKSPSALLRGSVFKLYCSKLIETEAKLLLLGLKEKGSWQNLSNG